jgi:hypothetical protein
MGRFAGKLLMLKIRWFRAVALLVAACGTPVCKAIVVGQVDNFEDGTVQGWRAGTANPNPPTNVNFGGPIGADDNYLLMRANGGTPSGAGGKLVAFNSPDQWRGDYLSAGVDSIQAQVKNFGETILALRLILVDLSTGSSLTTVTSVPIPAASGWSTVSFPLTSSNLTGGDFTSVMDSVSELTLVHSPNIIAERGEAPNIVAQLGVDNITALGAAGLAGDFNNDAVVGATDIDLLCDAIESSQPPGDFDVNGDGSLNDADLTYEVETILGTQFGDTDTDGDVDLADLGNLATGFGQTGERRWSRGNSDCDQDVDLNDLGTLATNFQSGRAAAMAEFAALVPEPTTLPFAALIALGLRRRRPPFGR